MAGSRLPCSKPLPVKGGTYFGNEYANNAFDCRNEVVALVSGKGHYTDDGHGDQRDTPTFRRPDALAEKQYRGKEEEDYLNLTDSKDHRRIRQRESGKSAQAPSHTG